MLVAGRPPRWRPARAVALEVMITTSRVATGSLIAHILACLDPCAKTQHGEWRCIGKQWRCSWLRRFGCSIATMERLINSSRAGDQCNLPRDCASLAGLGPLV